jgi:hypothetical protein
MIRLRPALALAAALCLAVAPLAAQVSPPNPFAVSVPSGMRMDGIPATSAIVGMMAGASSAGGSGCSGMEIGSSIGGGAGSVTASAFAMTAPSQPVAPLSAPAESRPPDPIR